MHRQSVALSSAAPSPPVRDRFGSPNACWVPDSRVARGQRGVTGVQSSMRSYRTVVAGSNDIGGARVGPRGVAEVGYSALVEALVASDGQILDRVSTQLRSEVPTYQRVDEGAVRRSIQLNLALVAQLLRTGDDGVSLELVDDMGAVITERFQAGITVEQMMQGHNIVMSGILTRLIELGERSSVSSGAVGHASQMLWRASYVVVQRVNSLMQQRMVDFALREHLQRSAFVRGLVSGQLESDALQAGVDAYLLDPDRHYHALRARVSRPADPERLAAALQDECSRGVGSALVTVLGRDCVGVVPAGVRTPIGASADTVVALGPPAPLHEVAGSFALAARILAWMARRSECGTRQLADLSWRLLVDDDPDANKRLHERYLAPLAKDPQLGTVIEESLRAFLARDRNVAQAALDLCVHPNTLRYRLRRYTQLTDVELESTEHLIGLAWSLEASRGCPGGQI